MQSLWLLTNEPEERFTLFGGLEWGYVCSNSSRKIGRDFGVTKFNLLNNN